MSEETLSDRIVGHLEGKQYLCGILHCRETRQLNGIYCLGHRLMLVCKYCGADGKVNINSIQTCYDCAYKTTFERNEPESKRRTTSVTSSFTVLLARLTTAL